MISIVVNNQASTRTVGITMPLDVKPGAYNFSLFGPDFMGQYNPTTTTFLAANSGKITILENNITTKRIKANFNFEAKEITGSAKATLSEGIFR